MDETESEHGGGRRLFNAVGGELFNVVDGGGRLMWLVLQMDRVSVAWSCHAILWACKSGERGEPGGSRFRGIRTAQAKNGVQESSKTALKSAQNGSYCPGNERVYLR